MDDRSPSQMVETACWIGGLLVAGVIGVHVARATAPPETQGDMWDSPLLLVAAIGPYFVTQIWLGLSDGSGLWVIGLISFVPLGGMTMAGALLGAWLSRRRHHGFLP